MTLSIGHTEVNYYRPKTGGSANLGYQFCEVEKATTTHILYDCEGPSDKIILILETFTISEESDRLVLDNSREMQRN